MFAEEEFLYCDGGRRTFLPIVRGEGRLDGAKRGGAACRGCRVGRSDCRPTVESLRPNARDKPDPAAAFREDIVVTY